MPVSGQWRSKSRILFKEIITVTILRQIFYKAAFVKGDILF